MIEKVFTYSTADTTAVERIIGGPDVRINHLSLATGEAVDAHETAESAHMIITRGTLGLSLNEQEEHVYKEGDIVAIPERTLLGIRNAGDVTMHLFVIKSV
ncbi:MAG TPA: cupin domain-containing protein [Sphaerochaetaceae bacterium]|jgi:quercetin dioxygenase-like cupin family protein|nr:cupin domain-containing protein [Sphaerochaetaceae bacterium]